jgi:hypothetical protein
MECGFVPLAKFPQAKFFAFAVAVLVPGAQSQVRTIGQPAHDEQSAGHQVLRTTNNSEVLRTTYHRRRDAYGLIADIT